MGKVTKSRPSIVVVLKLDEDNVPRLVTRAKNIVQRMTRNPWFPSPSPPVESADMYLKQLRGPLPQVFAAEPGSHSGEIDVTAPRAGDRAAYEFQYSLDGGETWLPFPQAVETKASATLPGMKPGVHGASPPSRHGERRDRRLERRHLDHRRVGSDAGAARAP